MGHLFFDLDRTLWDFETNSHETLTELFLEFELKERLQTDSETFIENYKRINESLWARYRVGEISKEELRATRWRETFAYFSYENDALGLSIGENYIARCPRKNKVFPGTYEVISALKERHTLHIITNGFQEVQYIKLNEAKLTDYFEVVVVSEELGVKKPDPKVFLHALELAGARAEDSAMIGDDLAVDCLGAIAVGMKGVWFNPHNEPASDKGACIEISELSELLQLF